MGLSHRKRPNCLPILPLLAECVAIAVTNAVANECFLGLKRFRLSSQESYLVSLVFDNFLALSSLLVFGFEPYQLCQLGS